jgi:hypothetical protein
MFDGALKKGRWEKTFSLENTQIESKARIEFVSSVHYPGKSSNPHGVAVYKTILHAEK